MAGKKVDYDPQVIEEFAYSLYRKAASATRGSLVTGVALGGLFGAVPLTPLGDAWPIPHAFGVATMLCGGVVGGYFGQVIGAARAFGYKLQAQAALCQVEIQRNSAAAVRATLVAAAAAPEAHAPVEPATPVNGIVTPAA